MKRSTPSTAFRTTIVAAGLAVAAVVTGGANAALFVKSPKPVVVAAKRTSAPAKRTSPTGSRAVIQNVILTYCLEGDAWVAGCAPSANGTTSLITPANVILTFASSSSEPGPNVRPVITGFGAYSVIDGYSWGIEK